jgi:hypothetical protein
MKIWQPPTIGLLFIDINYQSILNNSRTFVCGHMLILTFSQTQVEFSHYSKRYTKLLSELRLWLGHHYPAINTVNLKVGDIINSEYFDRIHELYELLKDFPQTLPTLQELDFGTNYYQYLIDHRSLKPIDLEIRRNCVVYRLDTETYWEKIEKPEFTYALFKDLIYTYLDYHVQHPDFVTQFQVHQYVVCRFSGASCLEDCYRHLNRYNY